MTGTRGDSAFWREKTLEAMSPQEWESLCDGCARCCLVKLEEEDTGVIHYTDIACALLDAGACRCRNYPDRARQVPDCVTLTPEAARALSWLPPTCAYRLVAEGRDLPHWHPLVSGRADSVHEAGVSVRGKTFCSEEEIDAEDSVTRIVAWPDRWPRGAKAPRPVKAPKRPKAPSA